MSVDESTALAIVPKRHKVALPNNTEAEAAVLSAMMQSSEATEEALAELIPDDFYRPAHRTLFRDLHTMHDRGLPLDAVSIIDYLRSEQDLAKAGGDAYIVELIGNMLPLVNWQHHADIVRRSAMLREIIVAAAGIIDLAEKSPSDIQTVIAEAEAMLLSVTAREVKSDFAPVGEYVDEAYREARVAYENGGALMGVPTGYESLDRMLLGFREGQLIILGARPAVGKTSFALNLALTAAAAGYTVAFFSLEMSGKEIAQRLMCAHGQVDMTRFRSGKMSKEDWRNIDSACRDLSRLDILIDDKPGTTMTEIRAKARRMLHKKKGIVILDYLQLVSPPPGQRAESRAVEVSEMSRSLKIMAKELKVPVIALSQLSRQVETRVGKRPQLSDLRESGSIEQDADIVMFLDRSANADEAARADRPQEGITRVILAKNRAGAIGDVDLAFISSSCKFYEYDETAPSF